MKITWILIGLSTYAVLLFSPVATLLHIPPRLDIFGSDAAQYSAGAKNLIKSGFYSLDGVHPYFEREPGQSVFLAISYILFGEENAIGVFVLHGLLFVVASYFFCLEIARQSTQRAGGITFLLLLTSGSTLQATFSANREMLTLVLLMTLTTIYLKKTTSLRASLIMGTILGVLLLTYYPYFFLFIPFGIVWLLDRKPPRLLVVCITTCLVIVSLWCTRNAIQIKQFTIVEGRRAAITLYSRGEQAERLRGLEPLRCLWSEYISRNWNGRSDACSIVGLWHLRWPNGIESVENIPLIQKEAKQKILAHPVSHLWISFFDVIELHLPFVGGGWSNAFNRYAMILHIILYAGMILGIRLLFRREWLILTVCMLYATVVFSLVDGIPRYLAPVIFSYCAFAGMGFDAALSSLSQRKGPAKKI